MHRARPRSGKRDLEDMPGTLFHGGFGNSIGMEFQPTWTEAPMYIADGIERELGITFHLPIRA
jgi:hypothetical protein